VADGCLAGLLVSDRALAVLGSARCAALRSWLAWRRHSALEGLRCYRAPALAAEMGVGKWVAYLPNWFWFVLRRVPRPQPAAGTGGAWQSMRR